MPIKTDSKIPVKFAGLHTGLCKFLTNFADGEDNGEGRLRVRNQDGMCYKYPAVSGHTHPVQTWGACSHLHLVWDCLPLKILRSPLVLLPDTAESGTRVCNVQETQLRRDLDSKHRART